MQKLQNHALKKINFKKFHHPIKQICKDHKILKFTDILGCIRSNEQNNALATSYLFSCPPFQTQLPDKICNATKKALVLARINMAKNLCVKYQFQCIPETTTTTTTKNIYF